MFPKCNLYRYIVVFRWMYDILVILRWWDKIRANDEQNLFSNLISIELISHRVSQNYCFHCSISGVSLHFWVWTTNPWWRWENQSKVKEEVPLVCLLRYILTNTKCSKMTSKYKKDNINRNISCCHSGRTGGWCPEIGSSLSFHHRAFPSSDASFGPLALAVHDDNFRNSPKDSANH